MKKKLISLSLTILITLVFLTSISSAQTILSVSHTIDINTQDEYMKVEESFTVTSDSEESLNNISFWITDKASDISILFDDNKINEEKIIKNNNVYNCNISNFNFNITNSAEIVIEYTIPITTDSFEKKLLRDTKTITINYNDENIYTGTSMNNNNKLTIKLFEKEETVLSIYTIITISLLVILLIVFTAYYLKKQKTTRKKEVVGVSKEYLETKRALLMSLLKDIEKQHRAKKISDDTYNKIKEHYKNEAVDAMRRIEDFESEVK